MKEAIGVHTSASAYAVMVCAVVGFFFFCRTGFSVAHVIFF
jgi:hypothetical protein